MISVVITSPEKSVTNACENISAFMQGGCVKIMPNHENISGLLKDGTIELETKDKKISKFNVSDATLFLKNNICNIVCSNFQAL